MKVVFLFQSSPLADFFRCIDLSELGVVVVGPEKSLLHHDIPLESCENGLENEGK